MGDIPQAAIDAALQARDESQELTDEGLVRDMLEAAEKVWPHDPPKRSPESTITTSLTIQSTPHQAPASAHAIGFGPPGGFS